jgi:hypothetical protein
MQISEMYFLEELRRVAAGSTKYAYIEKKIRIGKERKERKGC